MNKIKQFFGAVLFITILASCNGGKDKNAKGGTKTGNTGKVDNSVDGANKIIIYTNDVIDILKKYNEAVEEMVKEYENVEEKMNSKEKNIYLFGGTKFQLLMIEEKKAAVAFGSPTEALGSNRDFFADSLAKYKTLFVKFKAQQSTLDLYVKGKDYLDDDYAKGKSLIQDQYKLYDQLIVLRNSISDKIELLADEAEEITLKDDPMREAFIAAKQDLRKAKSLVHTINGIDNFTDTDISKIDAAYNDLTASIEAHKNIDKTSLIKGNKNVQYDRFYQFLTEGVTEFKAIIRDIKQNKKLENTDYNNMNRIIGNIIDQYNYWVG